MNITININIYGEPSGNNDNVITHNNMETCDNNDNDDELHNWLELVEKNKDEKFLFLDDNNITEIPMSWKPENITDLYLNDNNITEIPINWNPGDIQYLHLNGNNISEIPMNWNPHNIIYLYIDRNVTVYNKWRRKYPNCIIRQIC